MTQTDSQGKTDHPSAREGAPEAPRNKAGGPSKALPSLTERGPAGSQFDFWPQNDETSSLL